MEKVENYLANVAISNTGDNRVKDPIKKLILNPKIRAGIQINRAVI